MANIFNLYCEKLFHIIRQTLQKMDQNPQSYTFAIQTLSGNMYKFLVKDCLHDTLYTQAMLDVVDQSLNTDRTNILRHLKIPLLDSVSILREKFVSGGYLGK
jgi:hypothetical protein